MTRFAERRPYELLQERADQRRARSHLAGHVSLSLEEADELLAEYEALKQQLETERWANRTVIEQAREEANRLRRECGLHPDQELLP